MRRLLGGVKSFSTFNHKQLESRTTKQRQSKRTIIPKLTHHATRPFYLIYDQGFSNLWILEINGRVDMHHFEANGYANAWL